jgi:hypothetical protein
MNGMQHYSAKPVMIPACNVNVFKVTSSLNTTLELFCGIALRVSYDRPPYKISPLLSESREEKVGIIRFRPGGVCLIRTLESDVRIAQGIDALPPGFRVC